jgi:hypothetical protein
MMAALQARGKVSKRVSPTRAGQFQRLALAAAFVAGLTGACGGPGADNFPTSVDNRCPPGYTPVDGRCLRQPGPRPPAGGAGGVTDGGGSGGSGGAGGGMPMGVGGAAGTTPAPAAGTTGGAAPVAGAAGGTSGGPPPPVRRDGGTPVFPDGPSAPTMVTLTVSVEGDQAGDEDGGGAIRVSPDGTTCTEGTCRVLVARGTRVTLEATPNAVSMFQGWSGDCSGSGACLVVMDGDRAVSAAFRENLWRAPLPVFLSRMVVAGDNVYVSGQFEAPVQIAGSSLTPAGKSDALLASVSATLEPRWARRFGGLDYDSVNGLAAGPNDSLVVSGTFSGDMPISFEGRTIAQQRDIINTAFLGVLDTGGGLVSAYSVGGCNGLDVDSRGNTFYYPQYYPAQLAKKTLDGQTLWTYPEEWTFFIDDITVDRNDSPVLCSITIGSATLRLPGGPRTVSTSDMGLIVLKVNRDGAGQWITILQNARPSDQDSMYCNSVITDAQGDVYVTGYYSGSLSASGQTIRSKGSADVFLARLSGGNGNLLWLKSLGSPMYDNGLMSLIDDGGNLMVSLQLGAAADLGGMVIEDFGALLRISSATGAVMGRLLPELNARVLAMARHRASGDYFLLDGSAVRRVRLP